MGRVAGEKQEKGGKEDEDEGEGKQRAGKGPPLQAVPDEANDGLDAKFAKLVHSAENPLLSLRYTHEADSRQHEPGHSNALFQQQRRAQQESEAIIYRKRQERARVVLSKQCKRRLEAYRRAIVQAVRALAEDKARGGESRRTMCSRRRGGEEGGDTAQVPEESELQSQGDTPSKQRGEESSFRSWDALQIREFSLL